MSTDIQAGPGRPGADLWESLPKIRPHVDSIPRRLARSRFESELIAIPRDGRALHYAGRSAPVRRPGGQSPGASIRFGVAAEALSSAASSGRGYPAAPRPAVTGGDSGEQEETRACTARSSTPFTGGAWTATLGLTSAPLSCCRQTPGGGCLAGVLAVRELRRCVPVMPRGQTKTGSDPHF